MTQDKRDKRDWQKDMELAHTARYEYDIRHLNGVLDALFCWLQEAKERREREQLLKEAMNKIIIEFDNPHNETGIKTAYKMRRIAEEIFSTLYPDTPEPKEDEHGA